MIFMVKNMSVMGVGGKIMLVLLAALAVTEGISLWAAPMFRITEDYQGLVIAGIMLAVIGFSLNLIAAMGMLAAHRADRLATKGLYGVFLNPMYTFQLLLTVPGLLLLLNSWLVLLSVAPAFVAFKVFVKEEEQYLQEKFGAFYTEYKAKVLCKFL